MASMEDFRSLRIVVLAGGDSSEKQISAISGWTVVSALEKSGHQATWIDPAQVDLLTVPWDDFDACFIALHGGAGEDGRVQQELERLGVPYTGSGPAASWLAMSKSASKERFLQAGVPTPPYVLVETSDPPRHTARRAGAIGYPVVVKPESQGSSLGVSVAHNSRELRRAIAACASLDPFAIVESCIRGREFTVAVLDRRALPPLEIVTRGRVFSFDGKYSSPRANFPLVDHLPSDLQTELADMAVAAAAALDTRSLVRVDLMVDVANCPWVLEVNTIPGMTGRSLAPESARRMGMSMPELCSWMVRDCLTRETVS